jgi:hydroxypyruvate reductase
VASGPTLLPSLDSPEPTQVIAQYQLEHVLPESIIHTVNQYKNELGQPEEHQHYVLLDNSTALEAASAKALSLGFAIAIPNGIADQSIDEGCKLLLSRLNSLSSPGSPGKICLLSGGEFSCPVRGTGQGGRNLETVLRCAIRLHPTKSERQHSVVLSAGTDGIDGNSPAAGAIADELTFERGILAGMDAQAFLENSDSYQYFNTLTDSIITGPTGTNVRDIRVLLRAPID